MRLIKIKTFRENYFHSGEAPDVRTIRKAIELGDLPGCFKFGCFWVDIDKLSKTTSPLAQKVINNGSKNPQPVYQ